MLLLNAVLTVSPGKPASHAGRGWERFTDRAISELSARREGIVFLLWGKYAREKGASVDATRHHVLTASHPSPYSVGGFFGCRHFSQANAFLAASGRAADRLAPPLDDPKHVAHAGAAEDPRLAAPPGRDLRPLAVAHPVHVRAQRPDVGGEAVQRRLEHPVQRSFGVRTP